MLLSNTLVNVSGLNKLPKFLNQCQQVRFAKKTFRYRRGDYGHDPLVTRDDYIQAQESNQLEELGYKRIKFPRLWEVDSPLADQHYEKFVNRVMWDGDKAKAYELMQKTFYHIKSFQLAKLRKLKAKKGSNNEDDSSEDVEVNPMVVFKKALKNCEPYVITRAVQRGGAIYQVPYPITQLEREWYARMWIIDSVNERPKPKVKSFDLALAQELIDASQNQGKVIKKRDDIHRLAESNKAYAHYRWG